MKGQSNGEIQGARVELSGGEALISDDPTVYFTTPHFDGYPGILVRLDNISIEGLDRLITVAWLLWAPKRLTKAFLADRNL